MSDTPHFAEGLARAVELGVMPRSIIAAVVSVFAPEQLIADERRFLAGPIVIHKTSWNDTLPPWLADYAGGERVRIVFGLMPGYIIGPAELTAVMYGATLAHGLPSDLSDLYLWASAHACARKDGTAVEAFWRERLPTMEPIPDRWVLQPNGRLHHTYTGLANEVRRRVISAQQERERSEKREDKAATAEAESGAPQVVQLSLFRK